jgi:hypothetical protein
VCCFHFSLSYIYIFLERRFYPVYHVEACLAFSFSCLSWVISTYQLLLFFLNNCPRMEIPWCVCYFPHQQALGVSHAVGRGTQILGTQQSTERVGYWQESRHEACKMPHACEEQVGGGLGSLHYRQHWIPTQFVTWIRNHLRVCRSPYVPPVRMGMSRVVVGRQLGLRGTEVNVTLSHC